MHQILGIPGETDAQMVQTARYIGQSGVQGIKLHLLHVLRGTDLAEDYAAGKFEVLTPEHYIDLLERCLRVLPPETVIHRLTGDGAKRDLIAPLWSADKSACSMRSTPLSRATILHRVLRCSGVLRCACAGPGFGSCAQIQQCVPKKIIRKFVQKSS